MKHLLTLLIVIICIGLFANENISLSGDKSQPKTSTAEKKCKICRGKGFVFEKCGNCNGKGFVSVNTNRGNMYRPGNNYSKRGVHWRRLTKCPSCNTGKIDCKPGKVKVDCPECSVEKMDEP